MYGGLWLSTQFGGGLHGDIDDLHGGISIVSHGAHEEVLNFSQGKFVWGLVCGVWHEDCMYGVSHEDDLVYGESV